MSTYTLGIAKIEYAPVAGDGGVATTGWATLGLTKEGTAKLALADGTKTEFRAEESAQPAKISNTPGAITFDFEVMNPGVDQMAILFGGPVTSAGTSPVVKTWNMPVQPLTPSFALKVTSLEGLSFIFPIGQFVSKLNGDFTRTALFGIPITVTALAPSKAGIGPIQFLETVPA